MKAYIAARMAEASSWNAILGVVMASYMLPPPWAWLALAAGVAGVMLPDGGKP
jgi:hypothetical protein